MQLNSNGQTQPLRIAMLVSAPMPPMEGMGFYVLNLSRFLTYHGHSVEIFTRGGFERVTEIAVDGIPIRKSRYIPLYPFHVHLHGCFMRSIFKEYFATFDLLHVHSPLVPNIKLDIPKVLTIHTPMLHDVRSIPVTDLLSLLLRFQLPISVSLEKSVLRYADAISAVSSAVATELEDYGVDPKTIHVMGNGVDTRRFMPIRNLREEKPYVFACGRLSLRKGFEDLIESATYVCKQYPDLEFWIAGDGERKKALERLIRNFGVSENVRLIGQITDRDQVAKHYQGAIAFVHPAHYEGLPTVLLEAMACGTAVVSTAVSGALDVIENGKHGLLVPPKDPRTLSEAIMLLIENTSLRERLGAAARKRVVERYSWQKIASDYLRIYEEVLEKKAK